MRHRGLFIVALVALAVPASGQDTTTAPVVAAAPPVRAAVPFGVGERADYSVKFGPFSVGNGIMEVVGLDTIRGRETWHTLFRVRGGIPGFRVNDRMESWMDTQTLASLRHWQELDEGPNERERRFEIERQAAALRHAQQLWDQERSRQEAELSRERERLARQFQEQSAHRDEQLRSAEQLVAHQSQQLTRDRAELTADREAWEERRRVQAQALDEKTQTAEAELVDRRLRLEGRAEWIERQRAGLEQVRGEIAALHRQSLEMRLIAEQLWAQIGVRMSPT